MAAFPTRKSHTWFASQLRSGLRRFGVDVRRVRKPSARPLPMLYDEPLVALQYARAGRHAAFRCPLDLARDPNGLAFSSAGYHPYVAVLREGAAVYEGSALQRYFSGWQPRSASDAIVGFTPAGSPTLLGLPAHLVHLSPWETAPVEELDAKIRFWLVEGAGEHGLSDADPDRDGFNYHGPVSQRIGELDLERLRTTRASLQRHGYDRARGDAEAFILKRGEDLRFVIKGGRHRTGAMAAMGEDSIPARFPSRHQALVDVDEADHWPQVLAGVWSREDARRYVDHLFDFDSREWAVARGLISRYDH